VGRFLNPHAGAKAAGAGQIMLSSVGTLSSCGKTFLSTRQPAKLAKWNLPAGGLAALRTIVSRLLSPKMPILPRLRGCRRQGHDWVEADPHSPGRGRIVPPRPVHGLLAP